MAAAVSSMSAWDGILSPNRLSTINPSSSAASRRRNPKQKPQFLIRSQSPLHNHVFPLLSLPFYPRRSAVCILAAASAFDDAARVEEEEGEEEGELFEEEEEEEKGEFFEDEEEEEEEDVKEKRRLFVGNLPYSMTSSQLTEIFEEAGQVDSVEIIYDRVTDRSRGFAFLTMSSFAEAKQAIRMFDGSQVGGRTLKVNFPEIPRGGEKDIMGPRIRSSSRGYIDSPYKVYAGNLSWSLTSEGLKEAFESQPGLLGTKVIYERETGRSRGFGFVSFGSPEAAQAALASMNGVEVDGRPLRLSMANLTMDTVAPTQTTQEMEADSVGNEMQSTVIH